MPVTVGAHGSDGTVLLKCTPGEKGRAARHNRGFRAYVPYPGLAELGFQKELGSVDRSENFFGKGRIYQLNLIPGK